jgi:hypothetical protein
MDSKIMGLIDAEVARLPAKGKKNIRYRQYEDAKNRLSRRFPGYAEYEYLCKAIAKKYGI